MILKKSIYRLQIMILLLLLFGLGIIVGERFIVMIAFFGIFAYELYTIQKKSVFGFAFLISFFTFLCGRIFINWIFNENCLLEGPFIYDSKPSDSEVEQLLVIYLVSLITFSAFIKIFSKSSNNGSKNYTIHNRKLIQICLILFYITAGFDIVCSLERAVYSLLIGSYTSYYTSFERLLPSIIYEVAELAKPCFFVILAMRLNKRVLKPVFLVELINCSILLLSGQRNQLVRLLLFSLCYFFVRNKLNPEEKWFDKKWIIPLAISLPIGVVALQIWGTMRNGNSFNFNSFSDAIRDFFVDQGTTSVTLFQSIKLKDQFPNSNVNYTFSEIYNFLANNKIGSLFFSIPNYGQSTKELALYGNNFGATVTYLYIPYNYINGIGMGSTYLGESFFDFGYIGVFLISALYGFILSKAERALFDKKNSFAKLTIIMLFAEGILYSPRSSSFAFFVQGVNFTTLSLLALIMLLNSVFKTERNRYTEYGKDNGY